MTEQIKTFRFPLALIGLLQGFVYFGVSEYTSSNPQTNAILASAVVFAAMGGTILQLIWSEGKSKSRYLLSVLPSLIFALAALWTWWQLPESKGAFRGDSFRLGTFNTATIISLYVLLPYIQTYEEEGKLSFSYEKLFRHGWNNFFIISVALFFMCAFWGLMVLWGGLFKMIGIEFFWKAFTSKYFNLVFLPAAFGFGLALGRQNEKIINTLRNIALTLFKYLTPIVALISILFIASLPFTGLQPLWDTKQASALLLCLVILAILFVNAVFQDGSLERPYPVPVQCLLDIMLFFLPIFTVITLYSIYLRISQYGYTPERVYVLVFAILTGLYGTGYAFAVYRRTAIWIDKIRHVNIGMSFIVVLIAFLLHTPIMDPFTISANNQFNRLINGVADAANFDYEALKFKLGRKGYEKLLSLAEEKDHPQFEAIKKGVEKAKKAEYYPYRGSKPDKEVKREDMKIYPSGIKVPEELIEAINTDIPTWQKEQCTKKDCLLLSIDLDGDDIEEFVFIPGYTSSSFLFDRGVEGWEMTGTLNIVDGPSSSCCMADLIKSLEYGDVQIVENEYKDLKIGQSHFEVSKKRKKSKKK